MNIFETACKYTLILVEKKKQNKNIQTKQIKRGLWEAEFY